MKNKKWRLKRTKQCAKCPWKVDTDPYDIPDGYSAEKHCDLDRTIAEPGSLDSLTSRTINVMACHETESAHCVGWLVNQLGGGNNIALRMQMTTCANVKDIETFGQQHQHFRDTLPEDV